jgi:hypothetical protein
LPCLPRLGGTAALAAAVIAALAGATPAAASPDWVEWRPLSGPCAGDCAAAIYGGWYVEQSMTEVLITEPKLPFFWTYAGDHLVATTLSRRVATLWGRVDVEPEVGIGQRFGEQDETEAWAAAFFRWRGFPWDRWLVTTAAVSTGLNYATAVSEVERERARDDRGDRLMHFFSPEITFAAPNRPNVELLFRFHHRSGVWGLVSDAWGGAQYGTVGLRVRF